MRMTKRRAFAHLLMTSGCAFSIALAQPVVGVRVIDIQPTTGVTRTRLPFPAAGAVRLSKFMEEGLEVPAAILAVAWTQAPGFARADYRLQLEYQMDQQASIRRQTKALPHARGPQVTQFEIPLDPETGRRVSAWRLRLLSDEQVVDEWTSAAWR